MVGGIAAGAEGGLVILHHSQKVEREQEVRFVYEISIPPLSPPGAYFLQQGPTSCELHNLPKQRHLLGLSVCAPVGLVSHSNHSSRCCSAILAGGYLKVALGHLPFLHLLNTFYLLGFLPRTEKTKTRETTAGPNHSWYQGPKQNVVLVSEARW